jgi:hypothetical protein
MRKKLVDQGHWAEQNRLWETSGLSQQKYCEQQGLSYRQFIYWRGLLKERTSNNLNPKLLKITTTPTSLKQQIIAESNSNLEVILPSGIKLYIKSESDISKAYALIERLGGAR